MYRFKIFRFQLRHESFHLRLVIGVRTTPMTMSNNRDSSINARGLLSRFIIHFISPRMHAQLFTNTPLFINPSEYCLYTSIYIRDPFMEHLRRRGEGGKGGEKREMIEIEILMHCRKTR